MPMEALLSNLNENETVVIDHTSRNSYVQCIVGVAIELSYINTKVRNKTQNIVENADNNVKYLKDTKNQYETILLLLDNFQDSVNIVKSKFSDAYQNWLQNYFKKHRHLLKPEMFTNHVGEKEISLIQNKVQNIVEIDDSSDSGSDIEVVDVVEYKNLTKRTYSSMAPRIDNHSGAKESMAPRIDDDSRAEESMAPNNDHSRAKESMAPRIDDHSRSEKSMAPRINDCISIADDSIESKIDNCNLAERDMSPRIGTEEGNSQENNKANDKQDDLQENILLKNKKNDIIHLEQLQVDRSFERMNDLNLVEKKEKKRKLRTVHSSDSSHSSSQSNSMLKRRKSKRKKKEKLQLDCTKSNDNNNYYETSDSGNEMNHKHYNNNLSGFEYKDIQKDEQERDKQELLNSDSSEHSTIDFGNDESFEYSGKEKKKVLRTHSNRDVPKAKKYQKKEWSNNAILNFKVSHLKDNIKEIKDNAPRTTNELSSKSYNIAESTTERKQKEFREKLTLFPTKNDNIIGISTIDSDNSSIDEDIQIVHSERSKTNVINEQPLKSKSSGRRNIREVIDDQQTTEDTRKANRDEENRLRRLSERNEQFQNFINLVGIKNENKIVLDFDLNTKAELVTVNKELVKNLKPHQKEGLKFMWDSCFESVQEAKNTEGSGCILAHCMGLGKTLQVITLVYTLLVNDAIGIKTVMVLCPMNTILNWVDEFDIWLENVPKEKKINIYELTKIKKLAHRFEQFKIWHENGGVLILSYDMFRRITTRDEKLNSSQIKNRARYLLNPGADLVVCDEGHLLKNQESILANKIQDIRTKRRIILTGTPLQNNLSEYHFMVQFVKPNLLGTMQEFQNRFTNPITNGQFDNSTPNDVQLMKRRSHVLYTMLTGCVQRKSYTVLTPFLPPKQEYVILIRLSRLQLKMYQYYIDNIAKINAKNLFKNYHEIKQLVSHPKILYSIAKKKKSSNSNCKDNISQDAWCFNFVKSADLEDICISYKMILLFNILERCEREGDKLLVFSQCLHTLDAIQDFLKKIDPSSTDNLNGGHFHLQGEWKVGYDYFRLDGTVNSEKRNAAFKSFNDSSNKRARLFLISAKSGGLGVNLTGANRVVVFDPSWNPSTDLQSIARVFRFGQKKPCYIYRFLAEGTLEEKIYNRQVTKLSLALRVIDEQQIGRHYTDTDLAELYKFEPHIDEKSLISLPRDRVLADVLSKCKKYIYNYFEHDSLLENKEDEELDEEERKQAWLEYEQEKAKVKNTDALNKIKGTANKKKKRLLDKSPENTDNAIPECPPPLLIESANKTNGIVCESLPGDANASDCL